MQTMNNTETYLLTCPPCGATKLIAYSKAPWYDTEGYVLWSDGRVESNEWLEPAKTQQCQTCKHFFLLPKKDNLQDVQTPCRDTGRLPLQTLKQAIAELSGEGENVEWPRLEAWWAYNEMYKDVAEEDIPVGEREFNRANMQWLLDYYNKTEYGFQQLRFELLRLLGLENEYRQKLANMTYEKFAEWYCDRNKKRGIYISSDDERVRRRYADRVKELTAVLDKPLRPYPKT